MEDEIEDRINRIPFVGLYSSLKECMEMFHNTALYSDEKENRMPPRIEKIAVVGSFLTDDFKPEKSDMDVYIVLEEEYEHSEGFLRALKDSSLPYYNMVQSNAVSSVSNVDVVDTITSTEKELRGPYVLYDVDVGAAADEYSDRRN